MQLSKIGSKNTYHKCVKELHEAKYIYYHPTKSKFLPVRFSLIRLDLPAEKPTRYKQLDLFNSETTPDPSTDIDTVSVPILTDASTEIDTGTVPKMGRYIKPNFKKDKTVSYTPSENFYKAENPRTNQTAPAAVPISGHSAERSRSMSAGNTERSRSMPSMNEVETFFTDNNYPATEAQKFFLYNKGRGWMLRDKVPVKDWQALAHKWILNEGRQAGKKDKIASLPTADELYQRFSRGEKIFGLIAADHFQELSLQVTETELHEAWQERINQLTNVNNYTVTQLLQAYLAGNKENELITKDEPNLIALAKRIAVIKHLQKRLNSEI